MARGRSRTVFVTGGSRGIGKSIAIPAAREGANVVVAAKTEEPRPELLHRSFHSGRGGVAGGGG
ncbi:MAG: SDR family NAD(P)-dependent oxidoreductase [Gemmatimonadetes bacterium]|nr:SDR family NAD(P)-dependent oxidoreductase [Gemmatimonadota bacterium]